MNVIAMVKNGERFILSYDDCPASREEALHQLCVWIGDAELESFTWWDGCLMADRVRRPRDVVVVED